MAHLGNPSDTEVRVTVRLTPAVFEQVNELRVGARRGFNPQLVKMLENGLFAFNATCLERVDIDCLMNRDLRSVPIRLPGDVHASLVSWSKITGQSLNTLINVITHIEALRQMRYGEAIAYRIMTKHLPLDVVSRLREDAATTGKSVLEQAAIVITNNYTQNCRPQ